MRSEVQYFEGNVGNANLGRREGLRFLEVFLGLRYTVRSRFLILGRGRQVSG